MTTTTSVFCTQPTPLFYSKFLNNQSIMSWTRPALSFAQGAAITLGSTAVSCALALQVEQSTHRLFFWMAPHWYARVDQAHGLTEDDLQYARQVAQVRDVQLVGNLARHVCFRDSAALLLTTTRTAAPRREDDEQDSATLSKTTAFWNRVTIPSDEDRILESAPL